jgi:rubredoxin
MQWMCDVCGYVHDDDDLPNICPVCGAPKSKFTERYEDDEDILNERYEEGELDSYDDDFFREYEE